MLTPRALRNVVTLICVVWAINFTAALIPALSYDPSESINGIFLTVVGAVVTYTASKGKRTESDS